MQLAMSAASLSSSSERASRAVVVRTGAYIGAIPLEDVIEIVRPLRVQRVPGAPAYVRGVAVVRGVPVPVVDLAVLLGEPPSHDARWVLLRPTRGQRLVALSVDAMLGLRELSGKAMGEVPPLLGQARGASVTSLGALDRDLLLTLDAARAIPPDVWHALEVAEGQ